MCETVATMGERHWITHDDGQGLQFAACGRVFGATDHPAVKMPDALITCPMCSDQRERYTVATLTGAYLI